MVLVATVTKKSITWIMPGLWAMSLNMVLTDDDVSVINKDYSEHYREGDSIVAKQTAFVEVMQTDIDAYKDEASIFSDFQFTRLAERVETEIEV